MSESDLHLQIFFDHKGCLLPHDIIKEQGEQGHCCAAQLVPGVLLASVERLLTQDLEEGVLYFLKEETL